MKTVSDGVIRMVYVRPDNNYADLLTKSLSGDKYYTLCKPLMFT